MRKLILAFLPIIIAFITSCSNNDKVYTEAEYGKIIAEKYKLEYELNQIKNSITETSSFETVITSTSATAATESIITEPTETEPEVMAGKVETERKYLINPENLPWDSENMKCAAKYDFIQTYICYSPEMRVRAISGHKNYYTMTIKIPLDDEGLSRQEIDFKILESEYNDLLKKQVGNTIYKTRYQFWYENHYIAVDIYSGDLSGLAVAEIEFPDEKRAAEYKPPEWFGDEVTSDKQYKNAYLAKNGMPH